MRPYRAFTQLAFLFLLIYDLDGTGTFKLFIFILDYSLIDETLFWSLVLIILILSELTGVTPDTSDVSGGRHVYKVVDPIISTCSEEMLPTCRGSLNTVTIFQLEHFVIIRCPYRT
jgi:hypothetical protein